MNWSFYALILGFCIDLLLGEGIGGEGVAEIMEAYPLTARVIQQPMPPAAASPP